MRTIRVFAASVLCAFTALFAVGVFSVPFGGSPAGATTSQWQTTASFPPLANVTAISCAPSSSIASTTCVAVGEVGFNVPSIITTDDGGSVWNSVVPPQGTSTFTSVSCPTDSVCYASADQGIFKSTNGGISWSPIDSSFPAVSISCFTADQCTAVEGSEIVATLDGETWNPQSAPTGTSNLSSVSCPTRDDMRCHWSAQWRSRDIRNPERRHLVNSFRTRRRNSFSCLLWIGHKLCRCWNIPSTNWNQRQFKWTYALVRWNDACRCIAQCRELYRWLLFRSWNERQFNSVRPGIYKQWEYVGVPDNARQFS